MDSKGTSTDILSDTCIDLQCKNTLGTGNIISARTRDGHTDSKSKSFECCLGTECQQTSPTFSERDVHVMVVVSSDVINV